MGRKEDNIAKAMKLIEIPERIRNIDIAAHIDHGKTTLSDNLIAGAGMMSEDLAGKQLLLDYDEQEQARGITINAANASMVHEVDGKEYLINLIDTPGHVDFGGDVTRAMRAVDGTIIVVDSVEGVMPQTETVVRQALKEKVKPVLFINKVDRLINELKLNAEEMQKRFVKIITDVNRLITKYAPPEFSKQWQVNVQAGTVAFGSAYNNWALSVPAMNIFKISFKEIYDYVSTGRQKELAKKAPLHKVVLDMVIKNLPNPREAQKYRIPQIWKGDLDSEIGKAMLSCDDNGPVSMMVTKIIIDPHAGEIAVGRLFSGIIRKGSELYVSGAGKTKVQVLSMMVGPDRIPIDEIAAGNIVAIIGLKGAIAGSTVSSLSDMEPFEPMTHYTDPVVTLAIEAKHTADLPKLIDVLRTISKADPSIQVDINQETGEHLISGMGELHLEVTIYRIKNDYKVDVVTSEPLVVYRETVDKKGGPFEGKSPNKHNRFYFQVEPLPENVVSAILDGKIPEGSKFKDKKAVMANLEEAGLTHDEARGLVCIYGTNVMLDMTKGIQYLDETMELLIESFNEAMDKGPLANEKVYGLKVSLMDAKLHEDSIHRGPAQVIPAGRNSIYGAMCEAGRVLLEPMQKVFISVPQEIMGSVTNELQQRRGVVEDMQQNGEEITIIAKVPVAGMIGFASAIRSATGGKVIWNSENAGYQRVPYEMQKDVVAKIRERKGLKPEPYNEEYYASL
ncbi:elongation factor EF-2 [Picrophilus oshimae]|uniref:Elongation factor 2 n=2 Tax=Picrophilus torridus (strain ATCC 700027 / DSM 9790 / JCM 10055 / NBRC 100828 / KAW 2/3) TaxID=1122961 RepID=EF2_PICTO|nr:elongation factor EF-2 [Picrophilus oshimae]Q6L200.1 RecName: Full=Elongation factor 2; Short=EF-2 [Picrophilus oshimae DSM 9789]AAT43002.1 protein translation elongation factor [Picrophilus oshimae DSM 9789]SMD30696.1 translation elongation factor 2 (EF-2/EF-G) [Picrophilus oshimae DSM 9789]